MVSFSEPVPISRSTFTLVLRSVAVAEFLLFGFYLYIINDVGLMQGGWGWLMTAFGVLFFLANFYVIKFYLTRNTRVQEPDME